MPQGKTLKEKGEDFKASLVKHSGQVAAVLPSHISVDRFNRVAMTACLNLPQLLDATPGSRFLAFLECAQLGLEPGVLGQAWVLPYAMNKGTAKEKTVAQLIIGYRGYIHLHRNSGQIDSWIANVVCENDEFQFVDYPPSMHHVARTDGDRGERIAAYSAVKLFGGEWQPYRMTREQITKRKEKSASYQSKYSPWTIWEDEMWMKTPVRAHQKFLPISIENQAIVRANTLDDRAELGRDQFSDSAFADFQDLDETNEVKDQQAQQAEDAKGKQNG